MNLAAPFDIVTELYLGGVWVDISDDVYGEGDIQITRGTAEYSASVQPGTCRLKLDNKTGKYSAHNPTGPHYGKLRRNIPIRVSVDGHSRFLGEVSEWPLRADPNLHVPIEASGVLRRLSKSTSDELSPLYRGFMKAVEPLRVPAAYWPCEETDNQTTFLAAAAGKGAALNVNESSTGLGTRSGFLGSRTLITLNNSQVYGDIPSYGATSDMVMVGALIRLPDGGVAQNNTPIMTVNCDGTAAYWRVRANLNGTFNVQVADPFTDGGLGGVIGTSADTSWNLLGRAAFLALTLEEFAGSITWNLFAFPEYATAALTATGTLGSRTFLRANRVVFGSGFNAGATAVGHIAAWKVTTTAALTTYLLPLTNGHRGELAAARAERIAQEEGIVFAAQGDTSKSLPMIQQSVKPGLDLMTQAVEADGGFLYEPPDVVSYPLADGEDSTVGELIGSNATLTSTTAQAHSGARSVLATWNTSDGYVRSPQTYFLTGVSYTFSAWVRIPTGMPHVKLSVGTPESLTGIAESSPSTLNNTWQHLTVTWTATTYNYELRVFPTTSPSAGQTVYLDDVEVLTDRAGLHLLPLSEVYNQTAALTLDYGAAEIALPFNPTDDDRYLVNEAAVSVEGQGSPARYSLTSGPLSVQPPPNGAGKYSTDVTRNVLTGELAFNWASWLVHQGTWNEPRFPELTVNLNRKRSLIAAAAAVEPGSVIVGINLPAWLPPQQIKQVVFGLSETFNVRTWKITYNCAPARPYDTFQLDTSSYRLATSSTLASGVTTSATSLSVTSTSAGGRWDTSGIFPLTIMVAPVKGMIGEEMTVTAISGMGLTQTFTVTRAVNGVAVAWAAGSAVFLSQRPTLALGP